MFAAKRSGCETSLSGQPRKRCPLIKKHHVAIGGFTLLLFVFLLFLSSNNIEFTLGLNNTPTANYENVTVWTRVNVTNAKPEILALNIYDQVNGNGVNVTLSAGFYHQVDCNVTIRDWNGQEGNSPITGNITVNATLFHQSSFYNSINDNSTHYQNATCFNATGAYGQNGAYMNWTCSFAMRYYALNGSWNCTVVVNDVKVWKNYSVPRSNTTKINKLYALNITDGIDYGDMAVGEFSPVREVNVSNFGNLDINVTVQGYGRNINDGWAMVCNNSISTTNISIHDQAYYYTNATWLQMTNMTSGIQLVPNLTIPKRTDPTLSSFNNTYWQLWLDPNENPFGVCTGNVIFAATAP